MDYFGKLHRRIYAIQARRPITWKLGVGVTALAIVFCSGIAGYMLHEGWNFVDSYYMVVITLSTVGYTEVRPLSETGRIMTTFLILGGVGSFAYIVGSFTQLLVEGKLQMAWSQRRKQKMIDSLQDHFIVCGYGRIGTIVVQEIMHEGYPVVVVEKDPAILDQLEKEGVLHVAGDATADDVLLQAGLERARSLITALTQDAANVYVTLTARQLNPRLVIVARADSRVHIDRLQRAGADRVVMPHVIGGLRMAQSVLRPTVTNFLDLAVSTNIDLQMEELVVSQDSALVGKTVMQSDIRPRFNVIIISIKKASGDMIFNPGPHTVIEAGDTMVTVGSPENMKSLQGMCCVRGNSRQV